MVHHVEEVVGTERLTRPRENASEVCGGATGPSWQRDVGATIGGTRNTVLSSQPRNTKEQQTQKTRQSDQQASFRKLLTGT